METRPKRGLRNIRTNITQSNQVTQEPYKLHMRITALEMEKSRLNQEKTSALRRIETIDQRFAAIEGEIDSIQSRIDTIKSAEDPPAKPPSLEAPRTPSAPKPAPSRTTRRGSASEGFKIRY